MPQAMLRRAASRPPRGNDTSIGWISFSDALFLGFAFLLVYSLKLSHDMRGNETLMERKTAELQQKETQAKTTDTRLRDLEAALRAAREELNDVKLQAAQTASAQKRVRHELLGLRGTLRNVAIVVDGSQSMKIGGRWEEATHLIQQWVECLDLQTCVVIRFHNYVFRYPKTGVFDFENDRDSCVKQIREHLHGVKPNGRTNTLAALQMAYEMPGLDAIILFTDGCPNLDAKAGSEPELIEDIYKLCRSKKDIPINAIGIGDYFQPEFSKFLLTLAEITGGTFIGR
jgi:Mg-chelatase subunit ChlD